MAKSVFAPGVKLPAAWVNAMQDIQFDGQDIDGHYPPLTNASLANTAGNVRFDYYSFQNALKVSHSSGLNFAYTAGSALTNTGVVVAIAAGTIAVPDNATSWIYVSPGGVIAVAPAFPVQGMPLAKVTTAAGTIAGAIEDLRPRLAYPVGFLQNYLPAPLTIYVSPAGTGTGLSAADPTNIATASRLAVNLNRNGHSLTIKFADGTYSPGAGYKALVSIAGTTPNYNDYTPDDANYYDIVLEGNTANPQNVILSCNVLNTAIWVERCRCLIKGFTLDGNVASLQGIGGSDATIEVEDIRVTGGWQIAVNSGKGCLLTVDGDMEVVNAVNDANTLFGAGDGGILRLKSGVCTLTGTPNFAVATAIAANHGQIAATGMTFSGSATGTRYSAVDFGLIDAAGLGLSYFPGNAAGSPNASGFDATTGAIYRA